MKLETLNFGEVTVKEEDLITFPHGIPAFEELHKFVILRPDEEVPFFYLQSVEEGEVCFILTDPFLFQPAFEFQLSDSVLCELEIEDEQDVLVHTIVTTGDKLEEATMNLLAPIVINVRNRRGKQVILNDSKYRTKHKLIPQGAGSLEVASHASPNP